MTPVAASTESPSGSGGATANVVKRGMNVSGKSGEIGSSSSNWAEETPYVRPAGTGSAASGRFSPPSFAPKPVHFHEMGPAPRPVKAKCFAVNVSVNDLPGVPCTLRGTVVPQTTAVAVPVRAPCRPAVSVATIVAISGFAAEASTENVPFPAATEPFPFDVPSIVTPVNDPANVMLSLPDSAVMKRRTPPAVDVVRPATVNVFVGVVSVPLTAPRIVVVTSSVPATVPAPVCTDIRYWPSRQMGEICASIT
jgi:hypothetical protein